MINKYFWLRVLIVSQIICVLFYHGMNFNIGYSESLYVSGLQ